MKHPDSSAGDRHCLRRTRRRPLRRAPSFALLGAILLPGLLFAASPPAGQRNFVACPVLQDTDTVPCWVADYGGERYFLGIQTDSGGWSPPWLGHQVLVEGRLAGGPRVCGGLPLTSSYPASPLPSGSAEGRPLPNPPVVSVMRELDGNCRTLLPADPRYRIEPRRGPGPNTAASANRKFPPLPAPPQVAPPYQARSFVLTYDFDSELATRTTVEALKAVQYAQAIGARRITIRSHRGATLLSDGSLAVEIPAIARLRAAELALTLRRLGLPATTAIEQEAVEEPEAADGVNDPDRRRSELIVTP